MLRKSSGSSHIYKDLLANLTPANLDALKKFNETQNDLQAVRMLLANKEQIHNMLAQLEKQLVVFVGNLYNPETRRLAGDFMQRTSHNAGHKHVLWRYCETWSTSHGFSGVIKVNDSLSPEKFASMLISQSLFKDNAFKGKDHTALAHFWQWWCVTEYAAAHPGWLSQTPADLYRRIGEDKAFDWDNTFEFHLDVTRSTFIDSYSKIETFGSFLLSDECALRFPVLHQLTIRSENRNSISNSITDKITPAIG